MRIDNLLPDLLEREDQSRSSTGPASARELLRTAVLLDELGIIDIDRLVKDASESKPKPLGFSMLTTAH